MTPSAVAILSDDGVLVFDANGTPAAAAAVLAETRKLTPKPVRYLVLSHWHWDHWYGAEVYRRAFPGIRIISHEATRRLMTGPALVERRLAAARATGTGSSEVAGLERHLGARRIQLLHYDRAITPGHTFLYLPDEKVLVTGDLLINPITFALGCYPTGWIRTLEQLDRLDAAVIIPSHGAPLHDKTLLETHLALLQDLMREGTAAKARGLNVEQCRLRRLSRGLVSPPGVRRAERAADRRDRADSRALTRAGGVSCGGACRRRIPARHRRARDPP